MDIEQKISLFAGQMLCANPVYTWQYDADLRLLHTNCPDSGIFAEAFDLFGCKDAFAAYVKKNHLPIMLSDPAGLVWAAALHKEEDVLQQIVLLGPVLTTDAAMHSIEQNLREYSKDKGISLAWQGRLARAMQKATMMQVNLLQRFVLMLHYCLTGENLRIFDLQQQEIKPLAIPEKPDGPDRRDRHRTWMAEQALLRAVREGDRNFEAAFSTAADVSIGVPTAGGDAIRQPKNSVIVFISLCVRAAIDGGLSPEQAYSLGDSYIQSVEDSSTLSEISSYSYAMYTDFIEQVHKCRVNLDVSPQTRAACEYIELHTESPFTINDVAQRVGYAKYYLTQKFKAEMGVSINDYIKFARIERAKALLATTDLSIQDIAIRLQFCARSYFGKMFNQVVGCTPAEYRNNYKKF